MCLGNLEQPDQATAFQQKASASTDVLESEEHGSSGEFSKICAVRSNLALTFLEASAAVYGDAYGRQLAFPNS